LRPLQAEARPDTGLFSSAFLLDYKLQTCTSRAEELSSVVTNTRDQPKTMQNQTLQALFYSERYISSLKVLTQPEFLRMWCPFLIVPLMLPNHKIRVKGEIIWHYLTTCSTDGEPQR